MYPVFIGVYRDRYHGVELHASTDVSEIEHWGMDCVNRDIADGMFADSELPDSIDDMDELRTAEEIANLALDIFMFDGTELTNLKEDETWSTTIWLRE